VQTPQAAVLEVSFPNTIPDKRITAAEMNSWQWSDGWQDVLSNSQIIAKVAESANASVEFTFTGNGVVINGDWRRDGGQADVYLDGTLHRHIDTFYFWAGEQKPGSFLWHAMNLSPGEHTVKLVLSGSKKAESFGTKVHITGATIFKQKS